MHLPGDARPSSRASSAHPTPNTAPRSLTSLHSLGTGEDTYERFKTLSAIHGDTQLRTFGKWCNLYLTPDAHIHALETDLQDGRRLLQLLSSLSGKTLPRPEKGTLRFHRLSNVSNALTWLEGQKLSSSLSNIGSEDIVDGNVKLTLGLIWVLILRFDITLKFADGDNDTESDVGSRRGSVSEAGSVYDLASDSAPPKSLPIQEETSSPTSSPSVTPFGTLTGGGKKRTDTKRAPDARSCLLKWVRKRLAPLQPLLPPVKDLSSSWRSGALFAGLLHSHDQTILPGGLEAFADVEDQPDLWPARLDAIFRLAEDRLTIAPLLEPRDLTGVEVPDERSIMTYLSQYNTIIEEASRLRKKSLITDREAAEAMERAALEEKERSARQARESAWEERATSISLLLDSLDQWIAHMSSTLPPRSVPATDTSFAWQHILQSEAAFSSALATWSAGVSEGKGKLQAPLSDLSALESDLASSSDLPPSTTTEAVALSRSRVVSIEQSLQSLIDQGSLLASEAHVDDRIKRQLEGLDRLHQRYLPLEADLASLHTKRIYSALQDLNSDLAAFTAELEGDPSLPEYISQGLDHLASSIQGHISVLGALSPDVEAARDEASSLREELTRIERVGPTEWSEDAINELLSSLKRIEGALATLTSRVDIALASTDDASWSRESEVWAEVKSEITDISSRLLPLHRRSQWHRWEAQGKALLASLSGLHTASTDRCDASDWPDRLDEWKVVTVDASTEVARVSEQLSSLQSAIASEGGSLESEESTRVSLLCQSIVKETSHVGASLAEEDLRLTWHGRIAHTHGQLLALESSAQACLDRLLTSPVREASADADADLADASSPSGDLSPRDIDEISDLALQLEVLLVDCGNLRLERMSPPEWKRLGTGMARLDSAESTVSGTIDHLQGIVSARQELWLRAAQDAFVLESTRLHGRIEVVLSILQAKSTSPTTSVSSSKPADTKTPAGDKTYADVIAQAEADADDIMEGIAGLEDRLAETREALMLCGTPRLEALHHGLSSLYDAIGTAQATLARSARIAPAELALRSIRRTLRQHDLGRVRERAQVLELLESTFTLDALLPAQEAVAQTMLSDPLEEDGGIQNPEADASDLPLPPWLFEWEVDILARIKAEEDWVIETRGALERKLNRLKDKSASSSNLLTPGGETKRSDRSRPSSRASSPAPPSAPRSRAASPAPPFHPPSSIYASTAASTSRSRVSSPSPRPNGGTLQDRKVSATGLGLGLGIPGMSSPDRPKGRKLSINTSPYDPANPNGPRLITEERERARREAAAAASDVSSPKWSPGFDRAGFPAGYVPDRRIPLDVAVACVINAFPGHVQAARVKETGSSGKTGGYVGRYTFGETDQRTYYCRLLDNRLVMTRVGGGWMELAKFLSTHSSFEQKYIPSGGTFSPRGSVDLGGFV